MDGCQVPPEPASLRADGVVVRPRIFGKALNLRAGSRVGEGERGPSLMTDDDEAAFDDFLA
ncbi:hypothetical protein ACWCSD_53095, partial [Nonomuraea sp. NPDC001684]